VEIPAIIDIIAAAVWIGFVICGVRRGLFRALAGLLIVVLALVGARLAAEAAAPPAAALIHPAIEHRIERKLDETLGTPAEPEPGKMPEDSPGAEDLLALLGIRGDRLEELADQARETVRDTGASLLSAVAESAAESLLYGIFYILAFLLLLAGLNLLAKLLDQLLKLPVLYGANALGGGAVGLLEGLVVLALLAWVLGRFGVDLTGSRILQIFTTWL